MLFLNKLCVQDLKIVLQVMCDCYIYFLPNFRTTCYFVMPVIEDSTWIVVAHPCQSHPKVF